MHWYRDFPMFHSFGWIFMIFFWGLILYIVLSLIKKGCTGEQETAEEILKKRYARGEISKEEFERIKRDILQ